MDFTNLSIYDQIKIGKIEVNHYSSLEHRFWSKVDKEGPIHPTYGQCWRWVGSRRGKRYGTIMENGVAMAVHRYSWELHNDIIPDKLYVLHKCDNGLCVNPGHLFLGNQSDNMIDMYAKERGLVGEERHNAILTEDDVREVRRRYKPRNIRHGARALGREFGVSFVTVIKILQGKKWKHVK